jgi:outer membrane translocation and assembly module TamA
MVHAVGFGLRYRTPVGPVRLDLAYSLNASRFVGCAGYSNSDLLKCGQFNPETKQPLLPRRNDRINPFQFHFSIGQAF